MRKQVLFLITIGIGSCAIGQNSSSTISGVTPQKINAVGANLMLPCNKIRMGGASAFESSVNNGLQPVHRNQEKSFTSTTIGSTQYQLQTNASICNRIVRSADNSISATWTMDQAGDPWPSRGTGYNYFDGTNWGTAPANRIERVRTGFCNVGITSTGAEVIVSHETAVPAIHADYRVAKGTGAWTDTSIAGLPDTWARLAVGGANGHTLHVISSSGLGGGTTMITYQGQTGSVNYSRSLDGGTTWDILRYIIPSIDASNYLGFGGDSYAIDARGDNVAIVIGGFDVDVILLKSTDNGTTWTKTIVKRFPIPLYSAATMYTDTLNPSSSAVIDTIETNDASVAVLLDNQNKAHVWYGRMRVTCATPGTTSTTGLNYFPYTDGLMYWNENMTTGPMMIASALDLNGDGMLNVYTDPTGATLGVGTYNVGLTSHPSAGIDAAGKIYLAYSSVFEGLSSDGSVGGTISQGKSYFHTYVRRSDDGGATWCQPIDITDPSGNNLLEGIYGAVAKNVDAYMHIIVQNDNSPGHGVSANGTSPDPQGGGADIVYYQIPVGDLACGAGINTNSESVNTINLYPNPANGFVSIKFNVSKTAKATIAIYNVMGQEVANFDSQSVSNGTIWDINIANYNSGVYFVKSTIDGKLFTQKLAIE